MLSIILNIFVILALVAAVILLVIRYRLNSVVDNADLESSLDEEIEKLSRNTNVSSLMLGVYKNGQHFSKGYGDVTPDAQSVFQIGSITKIFTASLLQILSDEQQVSMGQTLGELIGKTTKLSPQAEAITLKQLANHTSGLPRIPKVYLSRLVEELGKDAVMTDPYSHLSWEEILTYLETTDENHRVGKFAYSNYGMGLLAYVLEQVTGQSYESLLQDKILSPLGMTDTGITPEKSALGNWVQGHNAKGVEAPSWTFNVLAGAGAMHSTVTDMLKFIQAHFDPKSPLFPHLSAMAQAKEIGWMLPGILGKFIGNNLVWHDGMVGGYAAYLSIDMKHKSAVLVLSNRATDVSIHGTMLSRLVRIHSFKKSL